MPEEKNKMVRESRPAVIWLTGILATYYAIDGVWRIVLKLLEHQSYPSAFRAANWITFVAAFGTVALGLFRRWRFCRWTAFALMVAWSVAGYWTALTMPLPNAHDQRMVIAMRIILVSVVTLIFLPVAGLIAFQPKVSRYFNPDPKCEVLPKNPAESN